MSRAIHSAVRSTWFALPAAVAVTYMATPSRTEARAEPRRIEREECVQRLLAEDGARTVPSAGQMLRRHSIIGRMIAQDYWFDMMESEQMVQDMICVYNKNTREFHTVVRVGRDVCGYPSTVHGGLTAAIADESFGGLYVSLWTAGVLGWRPPGLTARLEVDYKARLPSDSLIQCTVQLEEVDGRKVWMRASILDGNTGKQCAGAKALFVSPRWSSTLRRLLPTSKETR